ncbi:MAG: ABC transporter permease [Thermomicrobiales bacterium]|nr:ABC transporter permease [Thermomicrobiales bacterium]MCO5223031.1 ABC transporter permease [Thermomicrobiales bacterium]
MSAFLIRRVLLLIPMAFVLSAIVFWSIRLIPVDPASLVLGPFATPEQKVLATKKLGLDKPVYVQYALYLKNVGQGDLGLSTRSGKPVTDLILHALPYTLMLGGVALAISYLLAIPMGILSALRQNTFVDQFCMMFALIGMAIPAFWLGLLLILVFSVRLNWLPAIGADSWRHLILPAFALALEGTALTARLTRSATLEVLRQDYIRVARAKGLNERKVIWGHALRNAMIPIISLTGLRLGWIVGGAVIVEQIFAWPGMGRLLVESILNRDYPVVQAVLVLLGISVVLANLIADVLYALVDPRVRHASR